MGLLTKATNEQAYLKGGLLGFPGSGKTYTAVMLALGIAKRLSDGRPIAFFDTETGSDFLIGRFEAENIPLLRVKSMAFTDLLAAGTEAESACSVLIVDSITHVWRELCEAYQKRRNIRRMEFQHWADVKREWAAWTTFYLNSRLHILVCGRAGYEYDRELDDEGKKQLVKVGTKMKVEGEFGFEPSLLIEMERVSKDDQPNFDAKDGKPKRRIGGVWLHRAHVLKDRTDTINGRHFDFGKLHAAYRPGDWSQVFKPFEPVFNALNVGGTHLGLDASRTSEAMFDANGDGGRTARAKRVGVVLEEIQNTILLLYPGQTKEEKTLKLHLVQAIFGERAWAGVEQKSLEALEDGNILLRVVEERMGSGVNVGTPQALRELVDACRADLLIGTQQALEDAVV